MKDLFEMLLRYKNALLIQPKDESHQLTEEEKGFLVAAVGNIRSLGFVLSADCLMALCKCTLKEMSTYLQLSIYYLKEMVGADRPYNPMYPNFPKQVAKASDVELFFNALVHYWTYGLYVPHYEVESRKEYKEQGEARILNLAKEDDAVDIVRNLLNSPTSISQLDREALLTFFNAFDDYSTYLPDEIPFKENVAVVSALMFRSPDRYGVEGIGKYVKTATDVLRLLTALSDGDVSLAQKCTYRKLNRAERRMVMDLLSMCGKIDEDLFRYRQKWLRIGEILHPFTYKDSKYRGVVEAFDILRNKHKPRYFNGVVEALIEQKNVDDLLNMLKKRPTDFARRLDKVLRDNEQDADRILAAFAEVAQEVSTTVLLTIRAHFAERKMTDGCRYYIPKGNLAKLNVIEGELPPLSEEICQKVVATCENALMAIYREREPMSKVYVAPELKNIKVPYSQRSASETSQIVTRGSRFPFDGKVLRAFIWWTNLPNGERVDLDLSALILDKNWKYVEHISFTNLRNTSECYHSGDLTDGCDYEGAGVAEFIDLSVAKVRKAGGRYVLFSVLCYTKDTFDQIEHAMFGWMQRNKPNSGEIFEPASVVMKMNLTAKCASVMPVVFDCEKHEFVWCDMALTQTTFYNTIEMNASRMVQMARVIFDIKRPNLYDLVSLNAKVRGQLVDDPDEADMVFGMSRVEAKACDGEKWRYVSAYDIDFIVGNLL